jgi:hypothetical protein
MYRPIIVAWHSLPYWCLRRLQRTHHHGPGGKGNHGKEHGQQWFAGGATGRRADGGVFAGFATPGVKKPAPQHRMLISAPRKRSFRVVKSCA